MNVLRYGLACLLMFAGGSAVFAVESEPQAIISKIRAQCFTLLRDTMAHENSFVRSATVRAAGESGDPALVDLLKKGGGDIHPTTRLFALQALVKISGEDAYALAKTLVNDTDVWVQGGALEALADTGGGKSIPLIKPLLKAPDITVRLAAATSLYRLGEKDFLPVIIDTLKGADATLRYQAIGYLGKIGTAEVLPYLIQALDDPEDEIVFYGLQAIGDKGGVVPFARLRDLVRHKNPSVRYQAVLLMGYIPDSIPLVKELCADGDGMVRLSAAVSLNRLGSDACRQVFAESLKDPDFGIRSSAARILGTTPVADRARLLGLALRDPNSRVRTAAVRAVGMMGGADAFPLLVRMLDDSTEAIRAYAAGGLIKLMNNRGTK